MGQILGKKKKKKRGALGMSSKGRKRRGEEVGGDGGGKSVFALLSILPPPSPLFWRGGDEREVCLATYLSSLSDSPLVAPLRDKFRVTRPGCRVLRAR